jgi:hypothetical protein
MIVNILYCSGVSAFGAVAEITLSGTFTAVMFVLLDVDDEIEIAVFGVDTDFGVLATLIAAAAAAIAAVAAVAAGFLAFLDDEDDDELDT